MAAVVLCGRKREYLTPVEIDKLITGAKKASRYPQREATTILVIYRARRELQVDAARRRNDPAVLGRVFMGSSAGRNLCYFETDNTSRPVIGSPVVGTDPEIRRVVSRN